MTKCGVIGTLREKRSRTGKRRRSPSARHQLAIVDHRDPQKGNKERERVCGHRHRSGARWEVMATSVVVSTDAG